MIPSICLKVVEYPNENKRYNAPHLDSMGVYAQIVHSHIATQEMSAVRLSFHSENFHIFKQGCAKTLSICLSMVQLPRQHKIKNNFRNEQHPKGTLQNKNATTI